MAMSAVVGCGLGGGKVPFVAVGSQDPGFKMLAPDAHSRACGTVLWPYGRRSGGPLLQQAMAELVAVNPEADTIRDLQLSWRGIDLLVAQIGCVSVRGDVGRYIPTVQLPMLGEHGHHHE